MDRRGAESLCLSHFAVGPYDGGLENNRYHGFGTLTLTGNHEYAGMFKDGRRNGLGTMSWADGLKYVGPWVKNSATGHGVLSWPNGTEYFGDVFKGRREGHGILFHDVNMYCGEWASGKRHGFGLQVNPEVSYTGEWKDGKRHGWGLATFASGNTYCGAWREDRMHGYGTMTWMTNRQLKTLDQLEPMAPPSAAESNSAAAAANRDFVKHLRSLLGNVGCTSPGPLGPFTPSCVERADIFERYTGTFEDNAPHGLGQYEMYFFDGDSRDIPYDTTNQYNGCFVKGLRHGHGVQKYADGTMYDGEWSANMKHGKGTILHVDGTSDDVKMEHDAPRGNRPTTARSNVSANADTNASIEDSLELSDLCLSKRDREALKELLTRFKSSLKHLFICYSKLWKPEDYAAKAERMMAEDANVPLPLWMDRVDEDVKAQVAFGAAPQERNNRMVTAMAQRSERAARDAAEKASVVVAKASEQYAANASEKTNDEDAHDSDNDHDDFINVSGNKSAQDASSLSPQKSRKRPATPLNDSGVLRTASTRPPAPPLAPSRGAKLSHMAKYQLHMLLRDALILDSELTPVAVDDIIHNTLTRHETSSVGGGSVGACFNAADTMSDTLSFRIFVECIVRIADAKFTVTSTFAVPATTRKWTLADRLEFLLDHFLEPLRITVSEVEMSNELRSFDWPTFLADASGDHTLEDLRRYAYRVVQREQARQAAAAASNAPQKVTIKVPGAKGETATNEPLDVGDDSTVVAPPLATETFEGTVSDRLTFPLCPNTCVEIVTVDVTSSKGTERSHQLYLLKRNAAADGQLATFFGGVVPSYHPAVSTVDVYDVLAALPTQFLHLSSSLRPHLERNLRFLLTVYQSCPSPSNAGRANFGLFVQWLQRHGFLQDDAPPEASTRQRGDDDGGDGEEDEVDTSPQASRAHDVAEAVPPPPRIKADAFVRVCWEMELGCFLPVRGEYCCPSLYLERRSLVTGAIYEDPSFKSLLRVSPDLQEAVAIAVKHTELWDARRRTFMGVPTSQQTLGASNLWWLVAHRIDLTFQQFINIVLRLVLSLYGTTNVVDALIACMERMRGPEVVLSETRRMQAAVPPPAVVDAPLPVRRSANGAAVVGLVDDKGRKKPPGKK